VAVRMALGASRGRLFRQFVIESLLLALAATVAAVFVAVAGTQLLIAFAGTQIPRALEIALDWRVFLFLLGVGLSSGIAFGMIPALHSLNRDVNETLNTRGSRTSRAGKSTVVTHGLVIAEIGLAFMLLAGAGVLIGSAGAFVLTRFLRTLLYEVTPTDPLTFVVTTLLLVGVALIAYVNPARRIMKLNPMIVLRQE
jgi:ABC-type antimicrobial peptide transport system permease subunit